MSVAPDPQRQLGETIRKLRVALGHSQEDLAFVTGLHRTYIGSVERGERNVALKNIVRIAGALETTASDLMREAGL